MSDSNLSLPDFLEWKIISRKEEKKHEKNFFDRLFWSITQSENHRCWNKRFFFARIVGISFAQTRKIPILIREILKLF